MTKRRMLYIPLLRQDTFLDMPLASQYLYSQLVLEADDEGFVASPKSLCRLLGIDPAALTHLVERKFLLDVNGAFLIRHWHWHNRLRKERIVPSLLPQRRMVMKGADDLYEKLDPVPNC